jgi:hypothetical protein
MGPDESQFEHEVSFVFCHLYVCSIVNTSNIRC